MLFRSGARDARRIIQARNIPEESFDAHLWRLGARTIGTAVSVVIIGNAAQELGLPLYSVVDSHIILTSTS